MSIRDLRARARGQLHDALSVEAIYYSPDLATAIPCRVRTHHRTKPFGDMTGFDYQPAERIETVPEIVFLAAEVAPVRGGVVSIAADEAYNIEVPMPRDGITITAQVTRMSQSQIATAGITYPGAPAP